MNLNKPKFWDYKTPNIYAYLFLPFTYLIKIFNFIKFKSPKKTKIKTICVGNIYIGGTGKTSLSIKINKILRKKNIKSCFVKKYYKNQLDEQEILNSNGKLFMAKKRIDAIRDAEKENYEIAVLDDGLQDHSIKYNKSIVCFNNINWIGNGMTIPSGPLREDIKSITKYDFLFLNGNLENLEFLKLKLLNINPDIKFFVGKYEMVNLVEFNKKEKYFVFSGIGNHQTFISMLKANGFNIIKEIEYADHYKYTKKDIEEIIKSADKLNCKIITTEKDFFRIKNFNLEEINFVRSELKIIDEDKFIKDII